MEWLNFSSTTYETGLFEFKDKLLEWIFVLPNTYSFKVNGLLPEKITPEEIKKQDLESLRRTLENNGITLDAIREAKERFWNNVVTTPLQYSERLSKLYWAEIYIKREDLQFVRSYKIRWALNFIMSLSEEQRQAWIVCAS